MTPDQARELAILSHGMGRQLGLLIDRRGKPFWVIVGDPGGIFIPDLSQARRWPGRLRGLRLVHTHLGDEGLSQEDLMDMVFLRLDSVTALTVGQFGEPRHVHWAQILPPNPDSKPYMTEGPIPFHRVEVDFTAQAEALEDELARAGQTIAPKGALPGSAESTVGTTERAMLVSVATAPKHVQETSLDELTELARTAGVEVAGRLVQRVAKINPTTILGKGKLADLETSCLQTGAAVVIFDQVLTPAQMRNLADITERRILDRTQLILDIFAQHATTRSGKLQVELAQLQYRLPRLVGRHRALSRLAGGIGGRGPGETKLEEDRRKVRERIARLKKELDKLRGRRKATRSRRAKAGLPVAALVGYTNAGKSTLLNALTQSDVLCENKLFATLDPTTRRLRFPFEREIILTDTVGFIRELPNELREAFRATLEELDEADLLIHVADAGHPELEAQMAAVETILEDMDLARSPRILVLNKWDTLDKGQREGLSNAHPVALRLSALSRRGLDALSAELAARLFSPRSMLVDEPDCSAEKIMPQEPEHP